MKVDKGPGNNRKLEETRFGVLNSPDSLTLRHLNPSATVWWYRSSGSADLHPLKQAKLPTEKFHSLLLLSFYNIFV